MQLDKKSKIKVLFVTPYPLGGAPGQRFRYEMYLDILEKNGYEVTLNSFLDVETNKILYKKGNTFKKIMSVIHGLFNRLRLLFSVSKYSDVYIFREATPILFPWFEFIISNILKKKYIYDFDDAIWITNSSANNKIASTIKSAWKVAYLCKWAKTVTVGNQFLLDYAYSFNNHAIIIPTIVDTEQFHNKIKNQNSAKTVIGWTGSHSTLFYLDPIIEVINSLSQKYEFTFLVIADVDPKLKLKNYQFIKWNKDTEVEDLLNINIGIMPLKEDDWSKGKCGFKAIQYLSLGIPALVTPIGVNTEIVQEGIHGFHCTTTEEWQKKLEILLFDTNLRKKMGIAGRQHIVSNYSKKATTQKFLTLFE
jgi:glycosyltransferase involved in cell wall biosynthesis